MYSSIHWMKEMRAAHNATRPRQVARAPQRRRSARKAPCRGGAPPLPTVPRTRPPTVPLLGHRRRRGRRRRTRGVSHVGGSQSVGFLLGLDRLPGVGPPSSSRRPGPRRPYCCSYPCPYCTLPPSLPVRPQQETITLADSSRMKATRCLHEQTQPAPHAVACALPRHHLEVRTKFRPTLRFWIGESCSTTEAAAEPPRVTPPSATCGPREKRFTAPPLPPPPYHCPYFCPYCTLPPSLPRGPSKPTTATGNKAQAARPGPPRRVPRRRWAEQRRVTAAVLGSAGGVGGRPISTG